MKMHRHSRSVNGSGASGRRDGYVIFAVLIVIVVLSLVAYRFTAAMTAEAQASARARDDAQVKLAAVSGLHYAAAVLSDRDSFVSELEGNPFDNSDVFERVEVAASGNSRRTAYFDIRSVARLDGGTYEQRFGAIDEGGKININSMIVLDPTGNLLYNALMQLPNMTADVADAIVDWVDADDVPRASGAESSEYQSLPSPYKAKNGPLNSLDELLLVKGVTPDLLYGGDRNRNGTYDDGESGTSDLGWSDFLTVYGRELNLDSTGTVRAYLNGELDTMLPQLTSLLGDDLATYIIAYKMFTATKTDANGNPQTTTTTTATLSTNSGSGSASGTMTVTVTAAQPQAQQKGVQKATLAQLQAAVQTQGEANGWTGKNKINSVFDLINTRITLPRAKDAKQDDPDVVAYSPLLDAATRNDLLASLMDKTTVTKDVEMTPRINVNTAQREVLLGVPGMTEEYADTIINTRGDQAQTDAATLSGAWLITVANIPPATFQQMEKYVTGTAMVYRVQSIGYLGGNNGPVARMEAVIDTNQGAPRFLHIRDLTDLENPRGFDPTKTSQ
ncbi:general secretion pathway protein k : Type II secretory pathway component PulK-like protein OS=Planctomyces limnophilus (strain ATCC 43296 / DSM 3776 / IFAM 1008 / 290) GN=Plim_3639 PE=4 SV=1: T2SK [Gemmata massiliana]|uniref:T2SS protein K first SAM-like domain-containing protein n=1 Tax=Gemmata massiliana TaxID=1210884 RepID=A0A6P2CVV5_9BACT|nr:type II secretion system protein GspK [Gemmata massiliana]VTR91834.1 general secretion pathway protein k : Type II secretory pathway component PulK-like protein OS=Planctomyces limnophilus (strain ATCC 43296 / DSM 3776 / IFAM 1008 / 290) GN=Plim_3639 PE=4 SV=1: T2SK [Gemmata massiliana]